MLGEVTKDHYVLKWGTKGKRLSIEMAGGGMTSSDRLVSLLVKVSVRPLALLRSLVSPAQPCATCLNGSCSTFGPKLPI